VPKAGPPTEGWSRRELLQRAAFLAAATTAMTLAPGSRALALLDAGPDVKPLVRETYLGLAAYVFPGNDPYSIQQGVTAPTPGGPDTRALPRFVDGLNKYIPAEALTHSGLPLADGAAAVMNGFSLQVDGSSSGGPFPAPFANLTLANKNEVFKALETEANVSTAIPEVDFLAAVIITFAAEMFYSEAGHYDFHTKTFDGEPLGWKLSGYGGPADGHAELKGYYQDIHAFRRRSNVASLFPHHKPAKKAGH
jgi:hypothetical protein